MKKIVKKLLMTDQLRNVLRTKFICFFSYSVKLYVAHIFIRFFSTDNKMSGCVMLFIAVPVWFSVVRVCALGKWRF